MSMDNHWLGGPKQQLMRVLAPWVLHRSFSHAWVPGSPQKTYALKLGFKAERIQTGFYSADVPLFAPEAVYRTQAGDYPRRRSEERRVGKECSSWMVRCHLEKRN